jgi:LEA14-like dessication related protein
MRARAALCFVLSVCLLAGCSLFRPKLETPQLSIVSIALVKSGLWEQQFRVRMRVQNPNDLELPVKGIDCTMQVAGADVAHGSSAASFTVPALGEAEFDMNLTANMAAAVLHVLSSRGSDQIDYRISGKVRLSSGWVHTVPFDQHGTFALR